MIAHGVPRNVSIDTRHCDMHSLDYGARWITDCVKNGALIGCLRNTEWNETSARSIEKEVFTTALRD